MDLWQLHIFCRVVECKSFSKAAEAVHLSQPTVSSHIKDLEDHFGCLLIDRLSKKTAPTQAGRLLYGYARRMLALREEAQAALAQYQGKMQGHLVVGGSTIPGGYLLPRVIGKFKMEYPRIRPSLIIADTERIIAGIVEGSIELGVVGAESRDKNILQERLIDDEMRLIVTADHPWSALKKVLLERLLSEPFIIRERGSGTLKSMQECLKQGGRSIDELNIVAEMGSTEAVRQGIKDGIGVSILSTLAVTEDLDSGALRALSVEGLDLTRGLYVTRHRQRSLSPLAAAFVEFLKKHLQR
ncbi:MAG: selenium metabolism-associated LysR family transcriptional regulator [Desulfobacterales bacterium]|jgi:DNA-binding transcriptional LysR family regulator|nr:selenium metabolism-associated LysR family transcriptional regulator [Desulfobacterales bacterium]